MGLLTKRITLALASTALFCAVPAFARTNAPLPPKAQAEAPPPPPQDGGGPRRGGPERRVEMLQQALNLTPDQTTQVKTLLAAERTKMEALRSNTSLSQEDRRTQMMAIHQDSNTKMRALLTPDQVTKYNAMEARMREHRREGGPGGPGGPDGPPPPPQGPGL